jgi:integrase
MGIRLERAAGPLAEHSPGYQAELERLGYTRHTVRQHLVVVGQLDRYLLAEGAVLGAVPPAVPAVPGSAVGTVVERWRQYLLAERGMTPASARGYTDVVRPFLAARDDGSSVRLPKFLTPQQVQAMISACDPETAAGARDRAILLMLWRIRTRPPPVSTRASISRPCVAWPARGPGRRRSDGGVR